MKGLKMNVKQKALLNTIKIGSLILGGIAAVSFVAIALGPELLALIMAVFLLIFGLLMIYEYNVDKFEVEEKFTRKEPTLDMKNEKNDLV
jgi:uncharacterized membrane protein YfcA